MNSASQQAKVEKEVWVYVVYTPFCLPFQDGVADDVHRALKDLSEATSSVLEPAGLFLLPVHLI